MKWNQHQTNSRHDAKIKKLIRKYGPAGFGVYWFVVESIAEKLDTNLNCLLEYDYEDLANDLNMDLIALKAVLEYSVEIGLFTFFEGSVQCLKLLKYMDEWTKRKVTPELLRSHSRATPEQLPSKGSEVKEGSEGKKLNRSEGSTKPTPKPQVDGNIPKELLKLWEQEEEFFSMIKNPKYGTDQIAQFKAQLNLIQKKIADFPQPVQQLAP